MGFVRPPTLEDLIVVPFTEDTVELTSSGDHDAGAHKRQNILVPEHRWATRHARTSDEWLIADFKGVEQTFTGLGFLPRQDAWFNQVPINMKVYVPADTENADSNADDDNEDEWVEIFATEFERPTNASSPEQKFLIPETTCTKMKFVFHQENNYIGF